MNAKNKLKKIGVGIIGGIVLVVGVILIPYPGPGWLVVFAGLGILSTEFDWAKRLLSYAKGKYDAWEAWVRRQSPLVRALLFIATAIIVIATIWLLNGYGLINSWLNLGWDWVQSPLVK